MPSVEIDAPRVYPCCKHCRRDFHSKGRKGHADPCIQDDCPASDPRVRQTVGGSVLPPGAGSDE